MSDLPPCRPISFTTDLVRAILDGRKTQTRRLISPQPDLVLQSPGTPLILRCGGEPVALKFGVGGDRLWVRERCRIDSSGVAAIAYAADMNAAGRFRPPRWMPRSASRLTLAILKMRVERLADISPADAIAEGCPVARTDEPLTWFQQIWDAMAPVGGGFADNPWVFVFNFAVVPTPHSRDATSCENQTLLSARNA